MAYAIIFIIRLYLAENASWHDFEREFETHCKIFVKIDRKRETHKDVGEKWYEREKEREKGEDNEDEATHYRHLVR